MYKLCGTAALMMLGSCASPYAISVGEINFSAKQIPGVIQISDAKLYSRAALIEERRKEVAYLDGLIENSGSVMFEPQIMRELEQISSFSAAIGLSFDPAAALKYEQAQDKAVIQQEIDVLKLQLELDQLRRDAELFREKIAAQTSPSTNSLPQTSSSGNPGSNNSPTEAPDATSLISKIDAMNTKLADRLKTGDAGLAPRKSVGTADPIDVFHDRNAYRDLIKTFRNSENLDDGHDKNGYALMRFQLSATAFPPPASHMDSLGILRVEAVAPVFTEDEKKSLYLVWINFINQNLNLVRRERSADGETIVIAPNSRFFMLATSGDYFDIREFEIPRAPEHAADCEGFRRLSRKEDKCHYVNIATPKSAGSSGTLAESELDFLIGGEDWRADEFRSALLGLASTAPASPAQGAEQGSAAPLINIACNVDKSSPLANQPVGKDSDGPLRTYSDLVKEAQIAVRVGWRIEEALSAVLNLGLEEDLGNFPALWAIEKLSKVQQLQSDARHFLQAAAGHNADCAKPGSYDDVILPTQFETIFNTIDPVKIYDVGPRERAQRLSTVARAADALNLAAAIKGTAPNAGISGSGDFTYSRMAIGKADAMERAPTVVSFAEAKREIIQGSVDDQPSPSRQSPAFGWILGPKLTLNPKEKSLEFRHHVTPYELTADLLVPGWWPRITFRKVSVWGPDWRNNDGTTANLDGLKSTEMNVRLSPNAADMAALTDLLIKRNSPLASALKPRIVSVQPNKLSACSARTTVKISGTNIWRSTRVIVGGMEFSGESVRIAPDMSGVFVDIAAGALPQAKLRGAGMHPMDILVVNQDGEAHSSILVDHLNAEGACALTKAPAQDVAPKITAVKPKDVSVCNRTPKFEVEGQNLFDIESVKLQGETGTATVHADGKLLVIEFKIDDMIKFKGSTSLQLVVRTKTKGSAEAVVSASSPPC